MTNALDLEPPADNRKRCRPNDDEESISEEDINAIVTILGNQLLIVKKSIMTEKESYTPSAAVTFLLRRMDVVDPQDARSTEIYCLMTAFMTVYLCFIRVLIQQPDFGRFMQLFNDHDSLLNQETQPFLWFYAVHHMSIVDDLDKQLSTSTKHGAMAHIDSIFSKFYTQYFLEMSAAKHQKDHGQYYTPRSVLRFMWDRCATVSQLIQLLQRQQTGMCRVFDPCLGIGSFLCEFLTRFIKACRFTVWGDPQRLTQLLLQDIPDHIFGIEIDPFAYQLCKMNMMVHLYPLYQRLCELGIQLPPQSVHRLRLFCNDTLKLNVESNPFWNTETADQFEKYWLDQLRDTCKLKFDFIVTNPPYMIRKTGFITQPDPAIYDESRLGGAKLSQAYLYFMWIALQRCDDTHGQVCLITPSQWVVLEFAEQLRSWIWDHCKLLDIYEFEPFKVWPKVQTDSLIFRLCKRTSSLPSSNHTLYLRHVGKNMSLMHLLDIYHNFRPDQKQSHTDSSLKYKHTPLTEHNRQLKTKHSSFSFLLPSVSFLDQLESMTQHLGRICDIDPAAKVTTAAPLIWNRGPNTNPVYSLVVRTAWARETFGKETCDRWLKPCFYWNGKTISSATGGGKEGEFWRHRDPLRLGKKETSAAEAYTPYYGVDVPCYSMILVNKEDVDKLKEDFNNKGPWSALYLYLRDARVALQADKKEEDIANCQYNKCGLVPVKMIHPINCGYFTRSQPRPRFFIDRHEMTVTNQCIYFTIKSDYPWQDPDYYCGLLNSTLIMFFIKLHCSYDQQGRMRFFGRLMAYVPFAPPPTLEFMQQVATLVQGVTLARSCLYPFLHYCKGGQRLLERVRNFEWHLTPVEAGIVRHFEPPADWKEGISTNTAELHWMIDLIHTVNKDNAHDTLVVLLKLNSLFQLAIDQMIYHLYRIPQALQLEIEHDLKLDNLRQEWPNFSLHIPSEAEGTANILEWYQSILSRAKSFIDFSNK
ncbi:uncharacterized protein ATC70_005160 [Mucor velutinosus]|uniref:site-specific DNA-methyltransferase (adenine-specific) n=1 Tax=Mucor velutinosus TaxID=708070 RepID=A0AAN7HXI9_9FUNG|nr:hypothetical protein ATC70_005160 [Mucor velutinosus]